MNQRSLVLRLQHCRADCPHRVWWDAPGTHVLAADVAVGSALGALLPRGRPMDVGQSWALGRAVAIPVIDREHVTWPPRWLCHLLRTGPWTRGRLAKRTSYLSKSKVPIRDTERGIVITGWPRASQRRLSKSRPRPGSQGAVSQQRW